MAMLNNQRVAFDFVRFHMILSDLLGIVMWNKNKIRKNGEVDFFPVCFSQNPARYLWVEKGVQGHLNLNPAMTEL